MLFEHTEGVRCPSCGALDREAAKTEDSERDEWCATCCHPDGTHKTREEVHADLTDWLISGRCQEGGFYPARSQEEAELRAKILMEMQPAWKP